MDDNAEAIIASLNSLTEENETRKAQFETLKSHVGIYGYTVCSNVPYDGDCFFHSIAYHLGRPLSDSTKLRRELVDFIKSKVRITLMVVRAA
jgi:hypothetical protein